MYHVIGHNGICFWRDIELFAGGTVWCWKKAADNLAQREKQHINGPLKFNCNSPLDGLAAIDAINILRITPDLFTKKPNQPTKHTKELKMQ